MSKIKCKFLTAFSAFAFLGMLAMPGSKVLAGIGGSAVPDYPTPVSVGQNSVAVTLTLTNSSDGGNVSESVDVANIYHTPSCGSSANSICQGGNIDTGVFAVHSGTGRTGSACAGLTFTAGAPDGSGAVTFTPSGSVTLGPADGSGISKQCIIDFTVDVLKLPTVDASGSAGVQTKQLGSASFTGDSSGDDGGAFGSDTTTVKASPSISTKLSDESIGTGETIHDSATLTGATATAGGTATYSVYTDSDCETIYAGHQPSGNPKTVTNGVVPDSGNVTFDEVGTFYWQAVYSGDSKNEGSDSECASEVVTVDKASPSIKTTPSAGGTVGVVIHDVATLSGGYNPTGSVTFELFDVTDANCSGNPVFTDADVAISGLTATSDNFTTISEGTYRWIATYNGDSNNEPVSSGCQDEQVVITKPAGEYCSPGYWKQTQHFDSWIDYQPTQKFATVFGNSITVLGNKVAKGKPQPITNPTLLEALQANGSGWNLCARAAVDALLNASALDSGYDPQDVIDAFDDVISPDQCSAFASEFTAEGNCPLN